MTPIPEFLPHFNSIRCELVTFFIEDFYHFSDSHPEYELTGYKAILEKNGLEWNNEVMRNANADALDAQGVLAVLMGAVRAERCDGALLDFFKDGFISKWLKCLKDIDESSRRLRLRK